MSAGDERDPLPDLEVRCPACDGKGVIGNRVQGNAIAFGGPCNDCRGSGWAMTPAGEQVARLIRNMRRRGDL